MKNNHLPGVVPSKVDIRDYKIRSDVASAAPLPDEFSRVSPTVKNQGSKPTCAAHAGSTIIEGFYQSQHEKYRRFSTEWIYGHRYDYFGDGMSLRDVITTLYKLGDVYETELSGNHNVDEAMKIVSEKEDELKSSAYPHRITRYFRPNGETQMKRAIFDHGYLLVSMNVREKDHLEKNIWVTDTNNAMTGAHAVVIFGWNDRGWLVQNSWGSSWGDGGRFIIPFNFEFNEVWGTEDTDVEGDDLIEPYVSPIGRIFALIVNFIINLFKRRTT